MKSLKTYNLDQDVINILARQSNKSEFVCRAVRKLSAGDGTTLQDYSMFELIGALQSRFMRDSPESQLILTLIKLLQTDS